MVPLLNVPWQKVQVPVDVCLGMMCPFLAPGATAFAHSITWAMVKKDQKSEPNDAQG